MDMERRPFSAAGMVGLVEQAHLLPSSRDLLEWRTVVIKEGVYASVWKPVIDRALAVVLLIALLPTMLVIAGLVRWRLGPGVIFRQARVGRNGEVFTIFKFRTMTPVCPLGGMGLVKSAADPRHTPLGRVLRKLSLDELPQLWNVVRGDMSLVGPRPEIVELVEQHRLWNHPRHMVRPGLTGRWQTSQWRSRPLHEHVDEDLPYVRRITLLGDLRILAATVLAMVRRSGW